MKEVKEQILALRKALHDHNYRYYVLDDPIISDYEFDQSLRKLAALEKQYPEYHDPNSPTLRVGGRGYQRLSNGGSRIPNVFFRQCI